MITMDVLHEAIARATASGPDTWSLAVGLSPEARDYLEMTARVSARRGAKIDAIRMSGFQIGYEVAMIMNQKVEES